MAGCSTHKSGRCSCSAPTSVPVSGHWRDVKPRRKKRTPAKPKGAGWVVTSGGSSCGHHHRTINAALRCARTHNRKARAAHARLSRQQARKTRVRRWDVERVTA